MKCPKCGAEIAQGNAFCGSCGTKVVVTTQEQNHSSKGQETQKNGSIIGTIIGAIPLLLVACYLVYTWGGFGAKGKVNDASEKALKKYVYENFESTTDDIETEIIYSSGQDYIVVGRYKTEIISGCIVMHVIAYGGYDAVVNQITQTNEASVNYNYDYTKILKVLKAEWEIE